MPHHDHEIEVCDARGRHLGPAHLADAATPEQLQALREARAERARRLRADAKAAERLRRQRFAPTTSAEPAQRLGAVTAAQAESELAAADYTDVARLALPNLIPPAPPPAHPARSGGRHSAAPARLRFSRPVGGRCAGAWLPTCRRRLFPGRSAALPLDNATWTALERCREHRRGLGSDNPHLLVTRLTRTHRGPAGAAHIRDSLAPLGLLPRILRSTRLLTLADELDIKVLTVSLGMSYAGVAHYRPGTTTPPAGFT
jgi:hypothetical protein